MPTQGTLFVVSAPSGAGKTTLCRVLMKTMPGLAFAVSHTTRQPRPGETDGVDYHFVTMEDFRKMADRGEFLEWAEVHGNCYGTSRMMLMDLLSEGLDVLHDIDVQGARLLRQRLGSEIEAIYVFVLPPSFEALRERLVGRASDSPEVVSRRLNNALGEIKSYLEYEYVIVNDTLDEALKGLESLVKAARLGTRRVSSGWVEKTFLSHQEDGV